MNQLCYINYHCFLKKEGESFNIGSTPMQIITIFCTSQIHPTMMTDLPAKYVLCTSSVLTTCICVHAHKLLLYKLVSLHCTRLTCGGSIYPHIKALKSSSGILHVTPEDSCCVSLRVTVEDYTSGRRRTRSSPSSVVW